MKTYVGDFETTDRNGFMSVWLFDLCDLETLEHQTFTSLSDGLEWIQDDCIIYFHNIKFDGSYIIDYLFRSGYTWVKKQTAVKERGLMNFLITDSGVWFMGSVWLKHGPRIKLYDSYKKIPLKAEQIAESYKLPILKGCIDYNAPRPEGYSPTPEEISYVRNDTEIIARALTMHFNQGLDQMTAPADAFQAIKATVVDNYRKLGIQYMRQHPDVESYCRKAYFGGISWVNPLIINKEVGAGVVYDVNSLYPHVMRAYPYPVYYPVQMKEFSSVDDCLWISRFYVDVRRIPGALPTLRVGSSWVEGGYFGEVTLTNIDYELLRQNYDGEIRWLDGYKWRHSDDLLFTEFIDYWGEKKQHDKGGARQIDKLMMNSGYGKFGINPDKARKDAVFDPIKNIVRYPTCKEREKLLPNNVAIAAFVTSYARRELNRGILQSEGFCYCDTDSVHLATWVNPIIGETQTPSFAGEVHPTKLGAWKEESRFIRARYIRQKTYIEEAEDGSLEVKACGMPDSTKKYVTFENFRLGANYPGKLMPVVMPGGIKLVESTFTVCEGRVRF